MLESKADYRRYDFEPKEHAKQVNQHAVRKLVRTHTNSESKTETENVQLFELLEHIRNVQSDFNMPERLLTHLKSRPSSFFDMAPGSYSYNIRSRDQLPKDYRKQIADGSIDYKPVYREAKRRRKTGNTGDAVRAVSSLIEQNPDHTGLLRDTAYTLMSWNRNQDAYRLLLRAALKRPQEPHAYLATARLMERTGHPILAITFYEIALNGNWDDRFGNFRDIARAEYHRMLNATSKKTLPESLTRFVSVRKEDTAEAVDLNHTDLSVRISWNTDDTDVDLHVIDPTGEDCYYENKTTDLGGRLTADATEGYGPERFTLDQAKTGNYQIRVKYYESSDNRTRVRTRVFAEIYRRNPDGSLRITRKTTLLKKENDFNDLATIHLKKTE